MEDIMSSLGSVKRAIQEATTGGGVITLEQLRKMFPETSINLGAGID